MSMQRRDFLVAGLGLLASGRAGFRAATATNAEGLEREVGITTGSFAQQLKAQPERYRLPELLKIVRGELGMRVVDVYTPTLESFEPAYLDRVREAAEEAGCVLTNLKMNQPELDLASPDEALRERSLAEYRRSIDAAARLGMRWARPLPRTARPDRDLLVAGYRNLVEYGASRGVRLVVENFGWMQSDPRSVVNVLDAVGMNVAASPDTGNWDNNEVRYEGLALSFPKAVTCDFKARELSADGEHAAYDLKRCFTIGWDAGFCGPWCIEHGHADPAKLLADLRLIRDRLKAWMAERDRGGR
jgi:hypothetical protein